MNPRIDQLVRSLLRKNSLAECSLPELQQFAERHPYFGAAQLLLTKKMQQENPERYDEQLQKTFLFFHNPLWVEHILNDTGNAVITPAKKEPARKEILADPLPVNETVLPEESIPARVDTAVPQNEEPVTETTVPLPAESITAVNTAAEGMDEITSAGTTEPETVPAVKKEEPEWQIPTALALAEPATGTNDLFFEPYHTVDYFASQGIKFKEEEKPTDKSGKQLRRFTEWLKEMKRLPVAELAKTTEPVMEKKVEEMAEHSLLEGEVVTETMAEVWGKQGNRQKAIEIYRKLSLLEPAKSTYFAAKIEDLKKQN